MDLIYIRFSYIKKISRYKIGTLGQVTRLIRVMFDTLDIHSSIVSLQKARGPFVLSYHTSHERKLLIKRFARKVDVMGGSVVSTVWIFGLSLQYSHII